MAEDQKRSGARAAAAPEGEASSSQRDVTSAGKNDRDLGPKIEERRPGFWIEFILFLAGGYLAGLLSIVTYECTGLWVAASTGAAMFIAAIAIALTLRRRLG